MLRLALPVEGIQEAAVMSALTLGQRFGVTAIVPGSIPRHLRAFGTMGALSRFAGDRALGLGEAGKLAAEKALRVMRRVVNRADVPVIAGVSTPGVAAIGGLARASMDVGGGDDGCTAVDPQDRRADRHLLLQCGRNAGHYPFRSARFPIGHKCRYPHERHLDDH